MDALTERVLRASNLFSGASPEDIAAVAHVAHRKSWSRGEHIFRAGVRATFLGVVAHGIVKLVRPGHFDDRADGAAAIVALWGPRQTIGNLAVIAEDVYPGNAIVGSDEAEIVVIDAATIVAIAQRRPGVAWALARSLAEHGNALHQKIGILSAGTVDARLEALLGHLLERFGDEADDGTRHIPLSLSRSELASLVGSTVETTIRTMSKWQKQGLLETTAEGFRVLDPRWLRQGTRSAA